MTRHSVSDVIRAVARVGYSPEHDEDGSTAALLEAVATDIEQWHAVRRWWLKLRLRAKVKMINWGLRWFAVPFVLTLAALPLLAQAASLPDSLFMMPPAREALGVWRPDAPPRAFCITRAVDYGTLIVIIAVAPADTTDRPPCRATTGELLPLFLTAPDCPPPSFAPYPYPWALVRCGESEFRIVRRAR